MMVTRLPDVPHDKFKWTRKVQSVMDHEALLSLLQNPYILSQLNRFHTLKSPLIQGYPIYS